MRLIVALLCLAAPANAETPLSAEAFEGLVEGKTLTYSNITGPYGVEYYAPDRQVIWSFLGGECQVGVWYEEATEIGPSICFDYENSDESHCWFVYEVDGQIRADSRSNPNGSMLYQMDQAEPLVCGGVGT